jgi:hypothetical protein
VLPGPPTRGITPVLTPYKNIKKLKAILIIRVIVGALRFILVHNEAMIGK